jgi:hypothetical protein
VLTPRIARQITALGMHLIIIPQILHAIFRALLTHAQVAFLRNALQQQEQTAGTRLTVPLAVALSAQEQ